MFFGKNASLRRSDVIQVHIQDINKTVLRGFLSFEKIDSAIQVCGKNRDCETGIIGKKNETERPVNFG